MKRILIWPGILVGLYLLLLVYDLIIPCEDGFFIASCGLAKFFIIVGIFIDTLIYLLLTGVYLKLFNKSKKDLNFKKVIILGLSSIIAIFILAFYLPNFFIYVILGISQPLMETIKII